MGQGIDKGPGCRARMKVEPIFGGVRYKKREQLVPPFVSLIHCFFECIVCRKPVVCIITVAPCALITCKAKDSSPDGVPLAFGQRDCGERGGIVGHGVQWCELQSSYTHRDTMPSGCATLRTVHCWGFMGLGVL